MSVTTTSGTCSAAVDEERRGVVGCHPTTVDVVVGIQRGRGRPRGRGRCPRPARLWMRHAASLIRLPRPCTIRAWFASCSPRITTSCARGQPPCFMTSDEVDLVGTADRLRGAAPRRGRASARGRAHRHPHAADEHRPRASTPRGRSAASTPRSASVVPLAVRGGGVRLRAPEGRGRGARVPAQGAGRRRDRARPRAERGRPGGVGARSRQVVEAPRLGEGPHGAPRRSRSSPTASARSSSTWRRAQNNAAIA